MQIQADARKNEFRKFWALGDINEQNAYLLLQIKSFDKKVKKAPKDGVQNKAKTKSRNYIIIQVFKAVYDISSGRLGRILKQHDENLLQLPKDQRGGKNIAFDPFIVGVLTSVLTRMPKYMHTMSCLKTEMTTGYGTWLHVGQSLRTG